MINKDYLLVDESLFNMFNKSIKEGVWVKAWRGSSKWARQQVRHHSLGNLLENAIFYGVWLCEYFGPQKLWAKFILTFQDLQKWLANYLS